MRNYVPVLWIVVAILVIAMFLMMIGAININTD